MAVKLSSKETVFVKEYLVDLNASAACLRAGYATKNPDVMGSGLMKKPHVRAAIQSGMDDRAERIELEADEVVRELRNIALFDVGLLCDKKGDFLQLHKMPAQIRRAMAGVEMGARQVKTKALDNEGKPKYKTISVPEKVKLADKLRALDLLGRHLKLWSGEVTINPFNGLTDAELDDRIRRLSKK